MKNLIFICLLFFTKLTFSQKKLMPLWCKFWKEKKFEKAYNFEDVPTKIYAYIAVKDSSNITDKKENFSSGCVVAHNQKKTLFNWIATNHKNQFIVSITYGGKRLWTTYYYIDFTVPNKPKFYSIDKKFNPKTI